MDSEVLTIPLLEEDTKGLNTKRYELKCNEYLKEEKVLSENG